MEDGQWKLMMIVFLVISCIAVISIVYLEFGSEGDDSEDGEGDSRFMYRAMLISLLLLMLLMAFRKKYNPLLVTVPRSSPRAQTAPTWARR